MCIHCPYCDKPLFKKKAKVIDFETEEKSTIYICEECKISIEDKKRP